MGRREGGGPAAECGSEGGEERRGEPAAIAWEREREGMSENPKCGYIYRVIYRTELGLNGLGCLTEAGLLRITASENTLIN